MRKALDLFVTGILIIIYLACRIMMVPVFWKGQPAFQYWVADRDTDVWFSPRTKQIVALMVILLFLWVWWLCLALVALSYGYYLYRINRQFNKGASEINKA